VAYEFLSHRERIGADSILTHQYPSRESFFHVMKPITGSDLCRLHRKLENKTM
jgi:hypothetical protein